MSVPFDSQCRECFLRRNLPLARSLGDEKQAAEFSAALTALMDSAPRDASSPWFGPAISDLFHRIYGLDIDRFKEEKAESNRFVLARMDQIREKVASAPDPVFAGLQFAILGNYIDFSALKGEVSFEKLDAMLQNALEMDLDRDAYSHFCRELERGKTLLYLTDNAGEIGFDRIFAEEIFRKYPHLSITFCVRGGPANNDATREDASLIGIPFPVIDNGNRIPGTQLDQLSPEAARAMDSADVILSKGQGNAETLLGCGYNIYYAFLVKCIRFIQRFDKPKLTPMFVKERRPVAADDSSPKGLQ